MKIINQIHTLQKTELQNKVQKIKDELKTAQTQDYISKILSKTSLALIAGGFALFFIGLIINLFTHISRAVLSKLLTISLYMIEAGVILLAIHVTMDSLSKIEELENKLIEVIDDLDDLNQDYHNSLTQMPMVNNMNLTCARNDVLNSTFNITHPSNQTLTFTIIQPPIHGTVKINQGTFIYIPMANYTGLDSFTYQSHNGLNSNIAKITINIGNYFPLKK